MFKNNLKYLFFNRSTQKLIKNKTEELIIVTAELFIVVTNFPYLKYGLLVVLTNSPKTKIEIYTYTLSVRQRQGGSKCVDKSMNKQMGITNT